jgi:hypothetical protein
LSVCSCQSTAERKRSGRYGLLLTTESWQLKTRRFSTDMLVRAAHPTRMLFMSVQSEKKAFHHEPHEGHEDLRE